MIWCLRKLFFFYFLFLVSDSLSSFNHLELVFPFFFLWQSLLRLQLHIQGNFRWSQGGKCPLCPPLAPPLLTTIGKKKKKKNKSQSKIKPLPKIRERDVGRFGFLDSAISLYVGQVDVSGDLMECVVKKWWLRGRKWQREIWERAESVRSERRERRGIKNNKKWIATCYSMVLVIKSWQKCT